MNDLPGLSSLLPILLCGCVVAAENDSLWRAAQNRDAASVRALLAKGADVNARDDRGRTALLWAMQGSASEYKIIGADENIVRLLISHGADVNAADTEGWTPLLKAADLWAQQPGLLELLILNRANVNARLTDGRTALMLAARLGKTDRLLPVIDAGADVNARDGQGRTALMTAVDVQWDGAAMAMMKLLVRRGADLNVRDIRGRTAADIAAEAGYLERATFLFDAGARIADRDNFLKNARNYALLRAISTGSIETAKALLGQGADPNFHDSTGRTLLMIAAENEYSDEKARILLDHGAVVNLAGPANETPLMVASDMYQADIVKLLLDRGADPNATDASGRTVLMHAAASKRSWHEERKPLIRYLLEKGADPARKGPRGVTALMWMAHEGNPALPLLLVKRLDVNARDNDGNSALLYAAPFFIRGWNLRDGWALIKAGADVNAANHRGETALILAATQYDGQVAELLLQSGADVNARSKRGRTALMQAIDGPKDFDNDAHIVYSPDIAKALIAAGADVNVADVDGNSALKIALKRGYTDMAAELRKAGAKQ